MGHLLGEVCSLCLQKSSTTDLLSFSLVLDFSKRKGFVLKTAFKSFKIKPIRLEA